MFDWIIPFIQGFFSLDIIKYPVIALTICSLFSLVYLWIGCDEL